MKIILLYDLEMSDEKLVKEYAKFHKWIVMRGYIMLQYSVYFKTITAGQKYMQEIVALKKNIPSKGNIRTLLVSETQFYNMKLLNGELSLNEKYNSLERFIKL